MEEGFLTKGLSCPVSGSLDQLVRLSYPISPLQAWLGYRLSQASKAGERSPFGLGRGILPSPHWARQSCMGSFIWNRLLGLQRGCGQ